MQKVRDPAGSRQVGAKQAMPETCIGRTPINRQQPPAKRFVLVSVITGSENVRVRINESLYH
jgi:hypothetical protein